MGKYMLLVCSIVFSIACSNTEDPLNGECQGSIDTAPSGVFYIELVDSVGNNLIENGYFDRAIIASKLNGADFDYQTLIPYENPDFENLLIVYTIGTEGDNRWLLTLSETEVDTLDFNMASEDIRFVSEGILYCGGRFILNSANYNGMNIPLKESTYKIPITIQKPTD